MVILENEKLRLSVSEQGAEIRSLVRKRDGREMMWQADPDFWPRTSPVLFPLVGNYWQKTSLYRGQAYHLGQHGFARDMEFQLEPKSDSKREDIISSGSQNARTGGPGSSTALLETGTEICFLLEDTPGSREVYPFSFRLHVGYRLTGASVSVEWTVENPGDEEMFFSIGGHPAFCCDFGGGSLLYEKSASDQALSELESVIIASDGSGCLSERTKRLLLKEGKQLLSWGLFDEDALIFEDRQADRVTILDTEGAAQICVSFDAPLFGVWSPAGKHAPFVCIEPWYGRCDRVGYHQRLEEREYGNALMPGERFMASYTIEVC